MALDATITSVTREGSNLLLTLGPREAFDYVATGGEIAYSPPSEPGQSQVIIEQPTFEPVVGDTIWGGAGFAHIVSGGIEFPYVRHGYTSLREDWPKTSRQ